MKVYFDTKEERDAFNAAEGAYRGYDMVTTIEHYQDGEDANGFYILVDDW